MAAWVFSILNKGRYLSRTNRKITLSVNASTERKPAGDLLFKKRYFFKNWCHFRTLTGHSDSTKKHLVHGPCIIIEADHQPVAVQEGGTASEFLALENIPNVLELLRHV